MHLHNNCHCIHCRIELQDRLTYIEGVEYTAGVGQCSAGRRVSARAPRRELASKRRQDHAASQTAFLRMRRRDADQRCLVASALYTAQRLRDPNALRNRNAYKFQNPTRPRL